ncbi:hypothetical protein KJI95_17160 [Shewanella sp. JM162201]|uniref:Uncharacterized protein n=1 Tax=Shewanella jiangmenensis TaxID=2837387 RepID=A0ABS5V8D3_9GAMM|nr:hypothetical protein [Shewanella jiangmenensis]MBT1446228.1 hypothetical protein [Shewanella jiangmenensis]
MNNFMAGLNNFWVGLFAGIMLPLILVAVILYATVDKLTGVLQDSAIAPFLSRSEQTLDKVDNLLVTLDDKVDSASLKDLNLLAPLKDAQLFPELQALATTVTELKKAAAGAQNIDRDAVLKNLQQRLQDSLIAKFPPEKAAALAENLRQIAEVLASNEAVAEKLNAITENAGN